MHVNVGTGTYVVATSGGVDSMVLLDILRRRPGLKLIVAHFDHGMREDSHLDRKLVQDTAKHLGLTFVHHMGKLGPKASEAVAREARYNFLNHIKEVSGAKAIITAHHQDDVLETAILNLLRGSGRRGMTSLRSSDDIIRPLLAYEKEHIREYATDHAIRWREDPTNSDTRYTRNHIRAHIMPKLSAGQRAQLNILLQELHTINDELDAHIINLLHTQPTKNTLSRKWFVHLPHNIAREVIYGWLRQHGVQDINRASVERLVIAIKTGQPGKKIDVDKKLELHIGKQQAVLHRRSPAKSKLLKKTKTEKH